MKHIRLFSAITLLLIAAGPAFAADPVFPPGVRVGMVPLVGLVRAKTFIGFETEDGSVKVLVAELPADAYGEVVNAFKANPNGTGGIKPETIETSAGVAYYTVENAKTGATAVRRYSMILPGGTFAGYVAVQKRFVNRKPQTTYSLSARGRKALLDYVAHLESLLPATPKGRDK